MFLQPLDDPDVGQAERASAFEREANSRSCDGRRILRQPLHGKSNQRRKYGSPSK
jgi:hypothetical protein